MIYYKTKIKKEEENKNNRKQLRRASVRCYTVRQQETQYS